MKLPLVALLLTLSSPAFAEAEWLTDYHKALDKAASEHKHVLLDFTGSDWCPWCIKLKSEVFSQDQFVNYARERVVLVEVDFPRRKQLSAEQKESNNALARSFGIKGYPTVIILDSAGQRVGQLGYMQGGAGNFITELERIPGWKAGDGSPAVRNREAAQNRPPPALAPGAPAKPNFYADLALKGISGSAASRMAMINGEMFFVGDSAKVRVRNARVLVVCKEIREDSVLITADGKTCELKLGGK